MKKNGKNQKLFIEKITVSRLEDNCTRNLIGGLAAVVDLDPIHSCAPTVCLCDPTTQLVELKEV